MPRIPRNSLGEGVYHVINRGINRAKVLENDEDRDGFVQLLKEYRERFPVRVLHWVVMGNHFHLVLDVRDSKVLTALMAGLQRKYTALHHRRRRERREDACGYLWQGRFKSPMVERDPHLLACGRYVERNPVRAGLAEIPWDYRWSSARAYALGWQDGITDTRANGMYLSLASEPDQRETAWRTFLSENDAVDDEALFRGGKAAVGSERFLKRITVRRGRQAYSRRGKRR
jgi:putative transposase